MTATHKLLEVRDLRVGFATEGGLVQAVDGVSFDLAPGEVLAIVGESGSGKSVTAQTVLGLTRSPNSRIEGSVRLRGGELVDASEADLQKVRGDEIAMIFQDPMTSLNPVYRVGYQIVEAIRAHRRMSDADARALAVEMLTAVEIPEPERRIESYPHQLSGGQQQRVMIAMALALEPSVLIADEPTTALDVTIQAQILSLLARLNRERNLATILITHDFGVVAEIADRVLVMHEGRIVERGGLDEVFYEPKDPYTRSLLGAVIRFDRPPPPRPPALVEVQRIRHEMAGKRVSPYEGALLEVTDLVKHFPVKHGVFGREVDRVRAVDGVSLTVRRGETLGLVGESGSGKSTLARAILRLLEPTSGSIRFEGQEIAGLSQRQMRPIRRDLQIVFQDPYSSLNPRKRVGQIIGASLALQNVESDEVQRIRHEMTGKRVSPQSRERVEELLGRVGLSAELYDRYPHEFSGGQRQRIGIARALAMEPKLVVADEPVSALDVTIQAQIVELLADLQEDFGLSYVFVAHDIGVVRHVSDRIAVMYRGKIVEEGPADRVCEHPSHPYTQALLEAVPIPDPREARSRRQTVG
ncbi:MAG TPA: ABC transporter ATP-binding protein [Solirubrobacterales bacterium]|nr:ABC transporter ATP-binding protein [Solirubrobacterales bacterium]